MPSVWSKKDERMYAAIKKSCLQSDSRRTKTCPRIAASTVNKRRREEERTLSEFAVEPSLRRKYDPDNEIFSFFYQKCFKRIEKKQTRGTKAVVNRCTDEAIRASAKIIKKKARKR